MKKPLILLSSSYDEVTIVPGFYTYGNLHTNAEAVSDAGGLPVMVPYLADEKDYEQLVAEADGVFITGGCDVDPAFYGEELHECCEAVCPARDRSELALIRCALAQDKPLLCICRGSQILNVALGGTLYQDIELEAEGASRHRIFEKIAVPSHTVTVNPNSRLYRILGQTTLGTNSLHHQAVKDLGAGLKVVATAEDGMIEATELPEKKYVVAYQWHPEMMKESEQYFKIFADFIAACKQ